MTTDQMPLAPRQLAQEVQPPLVRIIECPRRDWGMWLLLWVALMGVSFALDGVVGSGLSLFQRGDLKRELAALGQWGQVSSLVIVGVLLVCLQGRRWRRLLDLALAAGLTWFVSFLFKTSVGRLRPRLETPYWFEGYLVQASDVAGHSGAPFSHYDLSSFPSSHTSAAMVLSLFVTLVWPRLWGFALAMLVLVGLSRYAFEAHWASDVLGGATIGFLVGYPILRGLFGVRLCDWVWKVLFNRGEAPAISDVVAAEHAALRRAD